MQTEEPYWLKEAYLPINERFDTGQFMRSLHNAAFIFTISGYLGLQSKFMVDYGCGSGLTARILRDVGCNAWGYDLYSEPRLLMGFQAKNLDGAHIINLCEVVEHFSEPSFNFDEIFQVRPKLVIIQTGILEMPNVDWHYLAPEHGQHIFFTSEETLDFLAKRYGMAATIIGGHIIFFEGSFVNLIYQNDAGHIRPDFASTIDSSMLMLLRALASNGYTYPTRDNALLSQS